MRGIIYDGTTSRLVEGIQVRDPGPREVIVEIGAAGLCHSDVSYMSGLYPVPSPGVCGHEGAGIVTTVGNAVTHVKPGDHVIIATLSSCGMCEYCASGRPTACRATLANWSQPFTFEGNPIFNFAATSAFVERTLVRDVQCVKIPDDVPLSSAAIVGCGVVTGMGAVFNRANVQRGQSAAVFGVGGVGLNVIQALRVQGATTIIAIDTVPEKESIARKFGATHFIDGKREDIVDAIAQICPSSATAPRGAFNSGGVNWAFDCVAHPTVTWNALESLDWEGTVVVSVWHRKQQSSKACMVASLRSTEASSVVAMVQSRHIAISHGLLKCIVAAMCYLMNLSPRFIRSKNGKTLFMRWKLEQLLAAFCRFSNSVHRCNFPLPR